MCVYAPRCKVWIVFLWRDVISVRVSIVTKFRSGVYFYKGVWHYAIFWANGNAPIAVCVCVRSASIYRVHTYLLGSISQMLHSHVCDDWSTCVMPYPYVWFLGTWRRFWLCVLCIDSSKLTHISSMDETTSKGEAAQAPTCWLAARSLQYLPPGLFSIWKRAYRLCSAQSLPKQIWNYMSRIYV